MKYQIWETFICQGGLISEIGPIWFKPGINISPVVSEWSFIELFLSSSDIKLIFHLISTLHFYIPSLPAIIKSILNKAQIY